MKPAIDRYRHVYPGLLALAVAALAAGCWQKIFGYPAEAPLLAEIQTTEDRVPLHILMDDRHLLLNFWSVTCSPCLQEIPHLKQLHHNTKDELAIVAVAMKYDPPANVLQMSKSRQMPYTVALDLDGKLAAEMRASFTPTYLLVAPDGRILDKWIGRMDFAGLAEQLRALRRG